ncbi:patatin-like phospholipase family protein [Candidatus Leptofilum sp.]|uniref:patatin-like phospholipase family protein n=1 Tax=Candidatus Leptofilum sp. TaxID=3241576 RepID=UPI003B5AF247
MKQSKNGRIRVGVALSGGVARGPVHVGVLSVLEREGIPIDCIAGVSAGSVVGAAYCAGLPMPNMREMAANLGWRNVANLTWPRHGLLSFDKMERLIVDLLGDLDIRDLAIPFATVVTDLDLGEQVVLREGRLATAVRASCSVPGFVTPVQMNGHCYCDGGVVDNLPVDAVRQLGADFVIGVDLFVPHYSRRLGPLGAGTAAIQTLVRQSGGGFKDADCLIQPEISGHSYLNFSRKKSEQYIALGAAAAQKVVPSLKAILNR